MSKEPNNIDRLMREKLDGFEMTPPPSVWENTSASLNSNRNKPFFLWFILGVALVAALGTSIYLFSTQTDKTEQLAANDTRHQETQLKSTDSIGKNLDSETNTSSNSDESSTDEIESGLNLAGSNDSNDPSGNASTNNDSQADRSGDSYHANSSKKARIDKDLSKKYLTLDGDSDDKLHSNGKQDSNDRLASNGSSDRNQKDRSVNGDQSRGGSDDGDRNGIGDNDTADNSSNDQTDNQSFGDENGHTDRSSSLASSETGNYGSLPLRSAELFTNEQPTIVNDSIEEGPLPEIIPFWKSLSIEGAIGVSTFRNQAKQSTSQSMLAALDSVASGQQSVDFRFGLNYHFTERFSFQSGIHYNSSRENYRFDSEESYTYSVIDTISFSIDSVTMDTTFVLDSTIYDSTFIVANDLQNTYRIFTLPFHFAWSQSISPRGVLEFALGGEISILGRNTGLIIVDNSGFSFDAQSGYHTTGMLSVGGSIKYLQRFGNHHSAYIEPWAQFGVTNQSKPMISYESLRRRYGIRVGYRFYF